MNEESLLRQVKPPPTKEHFISIRDGVLGCTCGDTGKPKNQFGLDRWVRRHTTRTGHKFKK